MEPLDAALAYAQALQALGERAQAVSVLQQASMRNPSNNALLGGYGRALADVGNYGQALEVLSRAHSPDQPDWRILSATGAVLDQMGRHQDAQRYYSSALKITPDDPSVLSNLGLSYALAKDLPKAEVTLRRAVERPGADPRVRQNLALVVGHRARRPAARGGHRQRRLPQADDVGPQRLGRPRPEEGARPADRQGGQDQQEASGRGAQYGRRIRQLNAAIALMAAGPRITTNSTGRKNTIIGTVSLGGSAAAFFSASDMRMSRFSCDITRRVCAIGVP